MAIVHINVPNGSQLSLLKTEDYTSYSSKVSAGSGYSTFESWFLDKNTNFWTYSDNSFDFGLFTLNWKHTGGDSNRQLIWSVVRNSDSQSLISATWNLGGNRPTIEFYIDFAIDRENQKGYIVIIGFQYLQFESKDQITRDLVDGGQDFYNLLVPPASGGAGSGYIGNSLVSNKKMVGYNVPTSSSASTKTESVNEVSASAVSGKPKSGNGFARIKFLRACWGGEEVPILWAGNSNKMTVQISNSSILFKLYTGDSVIYSFTAYAGSTIYDADNIYVGFLIDTNLELAKPSMIYDNNSVLSYNQEEPTDEQMSAIYTWLSAGL